MADDEPLAALVAQLSVPQKAALCLGSDFWHTAPVAEFGIEPIMLSDGPHGLRKQPERGDVAGPSGSVPATCFPTASALSSSWDPDLAHEVGAALGTEARAQDVAVVLGPGINIKRSPLCGRNFEYLSEDPHLAGRGILDSDTLIRMLGGFPLATLEAFGLGISRELVEKLVTTAGKHRTQRGGHSW